MIEVAVGRSCAAFRLAGLLKSGGASRSRVFGANRGRGPDGLGNVEGTYAYATICAGRRAENGSVGPYPNRMTMSGRRPGAPTSAARSDRSAATSTG